MPNPKDPEKLEAYREKQRAIALARGYGKWMQGRSPSPKSIAKMRQKQIVIGCNSEEREKRSQRARAIGVGKWMKGRTLPEEVKEKIVAHRRGKTYAEIYGERAEQEALKRRESNRARWNDVPRKTQRKKHNADHHYIPIGGKLYLREITTLAVFAGGTVANYRHITSSHGRSILICVLMWITE